MKYTQINPNLIKPQGWLKRQLEIQAGGLSGNLHKMWPDIRDSVRVGGDRNDWERVPYWLDGFIPLAYLLDDEEKIEVAKKYVYGILNGQKEDGWISTAPKEAQELNDNTWEYILTCKVLALYCDFTSDRKVENALYKALKCLYLCLKNEEIKLISWGKYRWFEGLIPILHVYKRKKEEWLIEFADILRGQGLDWTSVTDNWQIPINEWVMDTHIVNIAMMFKYEALCCEVFGDKYTNKAEELWQYLYKYHGAVAGAFNGDECLAGLNANRGYELCSIVELMYCCEILYASTGNNVWAERLERLAFNALPATISEDMWTHQYVQMTNQIACYRQPGKSFYSTNSPDANIFGLEPNFGCCTANFNQGWPKLAMNAFMKCRGGILAAMMLPATVSTKVKGSNVNITCETEYPFKHKCKYIVTTDKPVNFVFKIRIPSWAKELKVNGKTVAKKPYIVIRKEFSGTEEIKIEFTDTPHFINRPYNLKALQYGALLYALPIQIEKVMHEYEHNGVERKYPYCDYEYLPKSAWNYGFASKEFEVQEQIISDIPFAQDTPPVVIKTRMAQVKWPMAERYRLICDKKPSSTRPISEEQVIELIPYGCARLRMTEMPIIKTIK